MEFWALIQIEPDHRCCQTFDVDLNRRENIADMIFRTNLSMAVRIEYCISPAMTFS